MDTLREAAFPDDGEGDPILGEMARLAGANWRVTLFINGEHVTGAIVDADEYLRILDREVERYDQEMGSYAGALRARLTRPLNETSPGAEPADEGGFLTAKWIHLRDAAILHGTVSITVGLWRGRMRDVSGWSLRSPA